MRIKARLPSCVRLSHLRETQRLIGIIEKVKEKRHLESHSIYLQKPMWYRTSSQEKEVLVLCANRNFTLVTRMTNDVYPFLFLRTLCRNINERVFNTRYYPSLDFLKTQAYGWKEGIYSSEYTVIQRQAKKLTLCFTGLLVNRCRKPMKTKRKTRIEKNKARNNKDIKEIRAIEGRKKHKQEHGDSAFIVCLVFFYSEPYKLAQSAGLVS